MKSKKSKFLKQMLYIFSKRATVKEKAKWLKEQADRLAHISVWADLFLAVVTALILSYRKDLVVDNQYISLILHVAALQELATKIILLIVVGYLITIASMKIAKHYDKVLTERANGKG